MPIQTARRQHAGLVPSARSVLRQPPAQISRSKDVITTRGFRCYLYQRLEGLTVFIGRAADILLVLRVAATQTCAQPPQQACAHTGRPFGLRDEAFLAWQVGQGQRYELLGGEPMAMAGVKLRHDRVTGNAFSEIRRHVYRRRAWSPGRCRSARRGSGSAVHTPKPCRPAAPPQACAAGRPTSH